jgi:hypothetical protein
MSLIPESLPTAAGAREPLPTAVGAQEPLPLPLLLKTLGELHNTDKITHHRYDRFYPHEIDFIKDIKSPTAIFEIGLHEGASMKMWLDYFPNTHIYGLDILNSVEAPRVTVFKGDQSKRKDLETVVAKLQSGDDGTEAAIYLINDDGSHIPEHQILSFDVLFPLLQPGGVYIIEDIEVSYWTKNGIYGYPTNYGYQSSKNISEVFKLVADYVNREFLTPVKRAWLEEKLVDDIGFSKDLKKTLGQIRSITFAHNCILIKKVDSGDEIRLMDRQYRGGMNL